MQVHESAEDYLETILMLHHRTGYVRSIDIAHHLGYSKPSVSIAMKKLREMECIEMATDGTLTLLPKGLAIAERTLQRHKLLTTFLMRLGVDAETAETDACKLEHSLSDQSYDKLHQFMQTM